MRIAIVHPYPVSSRSVGGTTRVLALVKHLAPHHQVHVFTHSHGDAEGDAQAIAELEALGVEQRVIPRPPGSWFTKARWAAGRAPYFVSHNRNPVLEQALVALDREHGLDVAHVELVTLAPLLEGLGPRCARTLAEQELASLTVERLRDVSFRHMSAYQHYITLELPRIRAFEREALQGFDRLFAIQPGEAERMAKISGRPVDVLPHVVDTERFTPADHPPADSRVLFVGNYGHHPNVEAVFWLLEQVWPGVVREVPEARVSLVGPGLDAARTRRLSALGAEVTGRVEDLVGAYRGASVFANPILSGGGMRGKVVEAFACGVPVVSTRRGLEGAAAVHGESCLEANDAASFADAIVRLLREPGRRSELATQARRLVCERYDVRVVMSQLEAAFVEAVAERKRGTRPRA